MARLAVANALCAEGGDTVRRGIDRHTLCLCYDMAAIAIPAAFSPGTRYPAACCAASRRSRSRLGATLALLVAFCGQGGRLTFAARRSDRPAVITLLAVILRRVLCGGASSADFAPTGCHQRRGLGPREGGAYVLLEARSAQTGEPVVSNARCRRGTLPPRAGSGAGPLRADPAAAHRGHHRALRRTTHLWCSAGEVAHHSPIYWGKEASIRRDRGVKTMPRRREYLFDAVIR